MVIFIHYRILKNVPNNYELCKNAQNAITFKFGLNTAMSFIFCLVADFF